MYEKTSLLIAYDRKDVIDEAVDLASSAGYRVVDIIRQAYLKRSKYGISEKIVERLEELMVRYDPDTIIYDEVLKPSQNYNLASKLHRNVLDREALILEIFESRASSTESHLQVKLAQMRYELQRAKEKVRLAKLGEQPGFMGIGKFEQDVYYNDIKHRMHSIRNKLKKAGKQRELHRQGRARIGFNIVSLAGYTSAGKTTLFNKMTGESHQQGKELFTTLSTTIRRVENRKNIFLLSDTVGFISKLPAYMIEAFKSTLEEMVFADLVLLVIDSSDSFLRIKKKITSCERTLNSIGVDKKKIFLVFSKSDLDDYITICKKIIQLELDDRQKWIIVSCVTGQNISELHDMINNTLTNKNSK